MTDLRAMVVTAMVNAVICYDDFLSEVYSVEELRELFEKAFDAQYGIVRVVPTVMTEEMNRAWHEAWYDAHDAANAAGDLTGPGR